MTEYKANIIISLFRQSSSRFFSVCVSHQLKRDFGNCLT